MEFCQFSGSGPLGTPAEEPKEAATPILDTPDSKNKETRVSWSAVGV